ncbi:hypothetical protein BHM03_00002991 [Ensete ventricosum]|nr:hypothetical protein BHM03_00002991 [Ensete ventricosum]
MWLLRYKCPEATPLEWRKRFFFPGVRERERERQGGKRSASDRIDGEGDPSAACPPSASPTLPFFVPEWLAFDLGNRSPPCLFRSRWMDQLVFRHYFPLLILDNRLRFVPLGTVRLIRGTPASAMTSWLSRNCDLRWFITSYVILLCALLNPITICNSAYRTAICKSKRGGFKDTYPEELLTAVLKVCFPQICV